MSTGPICWCVLNCHWQLAVCLCMPLSLSAFSVDTFQVTPLFLAGSALGSLHCQYFASWLVWCALFTWLVRVVAPLCCCSLWNPISESLFSSCLSPFNAAGLACGCLHVVGMAVTGSRCGCPCSDGCSFLPDMCVAKGPVAPVSCLGSVLRDGCFWFFRTLHATRGQLQVLLAPGFWGAALCSRN